MREGRTPEGTQEYLNEYVYGAHDHTEYLELIGGASHLDELAADPTLGY